MTVKPRARLAGSEMPASLSASEALWHPWPPLESGDRLTRAEFERRYPPDDYLEGVPELILEIATSSAAHDLHDKLNAYRCNGVPECVVWQVSEDRLDWLCWEEGRYIPVEPDAERIIRSQVFPGLYLATYALLAGDLARMLATLQLGLQTEEHQAFADRLAAVATGRG